MDASQKSTEGDNIIVLSYLATSKLQLLPEFIESSLYITLSGLEHPGIKKTIKHAVNINDEDIFEVEIKGDVNGCLIVIDLERITDIDDYLDHICNKTYSVYKS